MLAALEAIQSHLGQIGISIYGRRFKDEKLLESCGAAYKTGKKAHTVSRASAYIVFASGIAIC
jgi:hypothetical protein